MSSGAIADWLSPCQVGMAASLTIPTADPSSEILGLKPRRSTAALILNMSIVHKIYARM
ncbi:MAG: hypothetical protein ACKPGO_01040 [Microcystis panniformis]